MFEIVNRNPYSFVRLFECHEENPDYYLSMRYHPGFVWFQGGTIELKDNGLARRLDIVHDDENEWKEMASESCFPSEKYVPGSKLYCIQYTEREQSEGGSSYESFHPDQPCPYHELFEEMDAQEEAERQKVFGLLHDSRNFSKRAAAKIIDNELHIFCETYNYDNPEKCEYYLMDYYCETYHFSVSDTSRFMTLYLSPEEYQQFYGKCNAAVMEQYDSLEALRKIQAKIPKSAYNYDGKRRDIRQKMQTFRRMQKEIDRMCLKLKLERAFIRSVSLIYYPIPGIEFITTVYILRYYKAEKAFGCADLDDIEWRKMSVEYYERSKKRAVFQLSDGRSVKLNRKDLFRGYSLGLDTVEEIGQFLLKYGKLSIRAYLKQTG